MSYPVWDVPVTGAGLVVAIIAIVHVFISHLAIGGGAFLLGAEVWSDRVPQGERVRSFLRRYVTFFLVFTTVFGAMTGVGIWFAIQLASPEGTSLLIHQFVFAWATEWVAFLGELTVLYFYYYGFGHVSRRLQVGLAAAYFGIAWVSLFIINGILTFMLTPGGWTLENRSLAAGFFNPGFVPALFVRTAVMILLAGLSGILVASRLKDMDLKARVVGFSARWVAPAAALLPLFVLWFWGTLPEASIKLVRGGVTGLAGGKLEIITRHVWLAGTAGGLVAAGTLVVALFPRAVTTTAAASLMVIMGFGVMGGEFFREMARKPFVINGVLYSNSLWKRRATPEALRRPFLARAHWRPDGLAPLSVAHGQWVYRLQCGTCHTRDGYRSLKVRTAQWTPDFGFRFLETMNAQGVMPPFQGTREDRAALTAYLLSLRGQHLDGAAVLAAVKQKAREEAASAAKPDEAAPAAPAARAPAAASAAPASSKPAPATPGHPRGAR